MTKAERATELKEQGLTYQQIADEIGLHPEAVRGLIRRCRAKRKNRPVTEPERIIFPDKPEKLSAPEIFDILENQQEVSNKFSDGNYMASVVINVDYPIGLSAISDVHLGNAATDIKALRADLNLIENDSRLFMLAGGDWCDSFLPSFKNAGAVLEQTISPDKQFHAADIILSNLAAKNKLVARCGGNHNDFLAKVSGINMDTWILRGQKPPYFPYGGLLKLTVGEMTYNILWKHKYRFNSTLNQFNSHHRALEQLYPYADIVIKEHEHNPGHEVIEKFDFDAKKTVVNVRTGSYKRGDPFSRSFYKEGCPGPQTLVLFPDRRKIVPFHGADAVSDAQRYLR